MPEHIDPNNGARQRKGGKKEGEGVERPLSLPPPPTHIIQPISDTETRLEEGQGQPKQE